MVKNPDLLWACQKLLSMVSNREEFKSFKQGAYFSGWGICPTLTYLKNQHDLKWTEREFNQLVRKWPKFSGDLDFPIPSPFEGVKAEDFYHSFPKWADEGLALRIELLNWLVSQLSRTDEHHFLLWLKNAVEKGQGVIEKEEFSVFLNQYWAKAGICHNYALFLEESGIAVKHDWAENILRMSLRWAKHSGNIEFPVPHPHQADDDPAGYKSERAQRAFNTFQAWGDHKYGQDRFELLELLIKVCEEHHHVRPFTSL